MADIPKNTYTPPAYAPGVAPQLPSLASQLLPANAKITGLLAGETLAQMDACYIKNDGKVWRATTTTGVDGFAAINAPVGEATTLLTNAVFQYPSALAPGALVYASANAGAIADAGTLVLGKVIDANRMYLKRSW